MVSLGYFEYLVDNQRSDGIIAEKSLADIVQQMIDTSRPQVFYLMASLRVYTLEQHGRASKYRLWQQIDSDQIVTFESLANVEYTPSEDDQLTDDDYQFSWWPCFTSKQLINRHEDAIQCVLPDQTACYTSCSSTDEILLMPIALAGSVNTNKLHSIQNLIEQFPMPFNVRWTQLPGAQQRT
jgi:hypothetical protein